MPRAIKEFRENGQLHRLAIVEGKNVVSIRVFDADGSEFKWVNPKPWRVNALGGLVAPKQAVKDDYQEENGVPDIGLPSDVLPPTRIGHRNSLAATPNIVDSERTALLAERSRLQEMVAILLERSERVQEIALGGLRDDVYSAMIRALDEIQRITADTNRRVFDEDR